MAAPSSREVDDWLSRVNDISDAVKEILNTDPMEDLSRHQARVKRRQEREEAEKKAKLEQIKMRYEPKNYARFERDDVIDAMLKAVDENPKKKDAGYLDLKDETLFSKAERISLEEARMLKADGAKHVQKANWEEAFKCYDGAIKLDPVDPQLKVILYNNRALVCNKLGKYLQTCEDASYVLQHEPSNVKALLRRGTALRYLHRPVEALQDVTQALRYEPNNSEGLLLRTWLHRAEEELIKSERFMESCEKDGTPDAANLCNAAETLSKLSADDMVNQSVPLEMALQVVQRHGTGAAVLFALRGGVTRVLSLSTTLLERVIHSDPKTWSPLTESPKAGEADEPPAMVAPLLYALRLLTSLFDDCETVSQDAREELVVDFIEKCMRLLQFFVDQHGEEGKETPVPHPLLQTVVNAVLECLTILYTPYPSQLAAALEADWWPLTSFWRVLASREVVGAKKKVSPLAVVTLFHFTRLVTACMHAKGSVIVLEQDTTRPSVLNQLFLPATSSSLASVSEAQGEKQGNHEAEMLLDVVEHCLVDGVPLPIQTVGVGLALRRTSVTVRSPFDPAATAAVSSASKKAAPAQFTRESWSKHLCDSIVDALRVCMGGKAAADHPHHLRFLEAGYSLVYNLSLSASDRPAFVKLWESLRAAPSFSRRTWDFVVSQQANLLSSELISAVVSKMLGVIAKFVSASSSVRSILGSPYGHNASKTSRKAAGELGCTNALPPLWSLLETLSGQCAASDAKQENEIRWDLLEHITTILAVQFQSTMSSGEGPTEKEADDELQGVVHRSAVRSLLALLKVAMPPSETTVQLWKASCTQSSTHTGTGPSTSTGTSSRPSAALVALGNAANLVGKIMDGSNRTTALQHEKTVAVLEEMDAVGVLLEALRTTRTSVLMLARERADADSKRITQVVPQLQLWEQHGLAAQKNLSIAVSKVVTASDAMRARLRELNGLETLAAVLGR